MYIRFVISDRDEDSGRRQGLFQAAAALRDAGVLDIYEEEQMDVLRKWFKEHLEKPKSFSRSRKPRATRVALSWFKDTAKLHIAKMYEFAAILEAHGVHVEVIRTTRPGYVVYEDEHQITAEPFSETGT
ncbi:MAG: hypothetical protein DMG06_30680 [Acidobacteria bacterium]|nr:MAG: hypothetical protein DMG06_30680 [Acidobacteriota bacterium]